MSRAVAKNKAVNLFSCERCEPKQTAMPDHVVSENSLAKSDPDLPTERIAVAVVLLRQGLRINAATTSDKVSPAVSKVALLSVSQQTQVGTSN